MISKATIKKIHALDMRKFRRNERLFVAEGPKLVDELCATMKPVYIAALPEWISENAKIVSGSENVYNRTITSITKDYDYASRKSKMVQW